MTEELNFKFYFILINLNSQHGYVLGTTVLESNVLLKTEFGAPGWLSQLSVRLQPGHDPLVREFEPRVRLWADSSEPGVSFGFCVSLSLSLPCSPFSLSLPKK